MNLFYLLITALLLTIASEFIILSLFVQRDLPFVLLIAILINSTTNPLLNYFHLILEYPVLPLEIGVIIVEAVLLTLLLKITIFRGAGLSLFMNGFSYLTGIIFLRFF